MYDVVIFAATYLLPTFLIVVLGYLVYWFLEPRISKIYSGRLIRRVRGERDAASKDPAPPQ
jgi:hypothetical protein